MPETRRSSARTSAVSSTGTIRKKKAPTAQNSASVEKNATAVAKKSAAASSSSSSVKSSKPSNTRTSEPLSKDILVHEAEYEGVLVSEMKYDALRAALKAMGLPARGTKIELASVLSDALKSSPLQSNSSEKVKESPVSSLKHAKKSTEGIKKNDKRAASQKLAVSTEDTSVAPKSTSKKRATRNSTVEPPTPSEISVFSKSGSKSSRSKKVDAVKEEREEEDDFKKEEEEDSDDASLAKYSTESDDDEDIAEDLVSMEEPQPIRKTSPAKVPEYWPSFGAGFINTGKPPVVLSSTKAKPVMEGPKFELPKPTPLESIPINIASGLTTKKQGLFSSLKQQVVAPALSTSAPNYTVQGPSSVVDLTTEEPSPKIDTNSEELLQSLNRRFMEAVQGGPKLSEVEHKLMLDLINNSRNQMELSEPTIVPKRYVENGPTTQNSAPVRMSYDGRGPSKPLEHKNICIDPVVEKRLASSFLAADSSENNTYQSSKRSRLAENLWGTTVSVSVAPALGMTDPRDNVGIFPRHATSVQTPVKANFVRHGGASLLGLQPTPSRQDLKRNLLVTSLQRRKSYGGRQQTPIKPIADASIHEGSKTIAKRILQSLGDMASPLEVHRRKPVAAHWGINGPFGKAEVVFPPLADEIRIDIFGTTENSSSDKQINSTSGAIDSHFLKVSNKLVDDHGVDIVSYDENSIYLEKNGVAVGEDGDFAFAAPLLIQEDLNDFEEADKSTLKMKFSFSAPSTAEKQYQLVNNKIESTKLENDEGVKVIRNEAQVVKGAEGENEKPKKSIWEMASNKWKCEVCLGQNDLNVQECILCDAPKGAPPVMGGAPDAAAEAPKPPIKPFKGFAPSKTATTTSGSISAGGFTFGVTTSVDSAASSDEKLKDQEAPSNNESSSKSSPFVFGTAPKSTGEETTKDAKIGDRSSNTSEKKSGFIFGASPSVNELPSASSDASSTNEREKAETPSSAVTSIGSSSGSLGAPSFSFGSALLTAAPDKESTTVPFSFKAPGSTKIESVLSMPSNTEVGSGDAGATKKKRAVDEDNDHKRESEKKSTSGLPKFPEFGTVTTDSSGSLGAPTSEVAKVASSSLSSSNPFSSATSSSLPISAPDAKPSYATSSVFGSIKSSSTPAASTAPFSFPSIPMDAIKSNTAKVTSESSLASTKAPEAVTLTNPFASSAAPKSDTSSAIAPAVPPNPFGASSSTTPSLTTANPFSIKTDATSALAVIPNPFSSGVSDALKNSSKKSTEIVNPFATSSASSAANNDSKVVTNSAPASPPRTTRADSHHSQAADSPMSTMDTGYSSETNSNHGSSSSSLPPPSFAFGGGGSLVFGASNGIASMSSAAPATSTSTAPVNIFGSSPMTTAAANPFNSAVTNPFSSTGSTSFPVIPAADPFGSSGNKPQLTSNQPASNPFRFGDGSIATTSTSQFGSVPSTNFVTSAMTNQFGAAAPQTTSAPLVTNPFGGGLGGGLGGVAPAPSAGGFSVGATNNQAGRRKVRVKRG